MATRGATLKMVKEIKVAFDPFGGDAVTAAREFVRRVSSPKLLETNPKFKLSTTVKHDGTDPYMEVTFVDNEKVVIDATDIKFPDMYADFIKLCKLKE